EIRLQLLAITHFRKAVEEQTLKKKDDTEHVKYLIGELYRRANEFNQAIEWFSQVEEPRKRDAEKQMALAQNNDASPTFFSN
ncbi:MAG: DUF2225 domain-containing protein, partial [Candidatus Hodarchaeota archaeon]